MATESVITLSCAQTAALNPSTPMCLSCGAELSPILARLGSLRCHACRALDAPLQLCLVPPPARWAA
jgi:hypothetical protein